MNNSKPKKGRTAPALILYTSIVMLFCCGSSPLVNHMNTDSSVYFTIVRAMAAGKVPYLDLFDHKGLYIYQRRK